MEVPNTRTSIEKMVGAVKTVTIFGHVARPKLFMVDHPNPLSTRSEDRQTDNLSLYPAVMQCTHTVILSSPESAGR
ncbi:hypothetical protein M8J76_017123 [Diaphorina citri]|nr:hypothetical protein M8J76_017123 [Diaphorina citri]